MARGEGFTSSDIDVAVLSYGRGKESAFDLRLTLYADLCRALKRNDIDVVLLNTTDNVFLLDEIVRSGIVLYDGDSGFREAFENRIIHEAIDLKGKDYTSWVPDGKKSQQDRQDQGAPRSAQVHQARMPGTFRIRPDFTRGTASLPLSADGRLHRVC
jgi:predicted nucleotidyltransferase